MLEEMWELVGPEHELPMKDLIKKEVEQPQRYGQVKAEML